ncbi:MAG: HAMP domain-containing sensor histidine kinase [Clostridia bacterium]
MKLSLRTKLSLSYVLVALLLVAAISFLSNFFLDKQFQSYVLSQQEQKNKSTVTRINQQYNDNGKGWNGVNLENIGESALEDGIIIKLKDSTGKTIWDARLHNKGLCSKMLSHMEENMASRYNDFKGGYVEKEYPLTYNAREIGNVKLGYYGPFYFTDDDLDFISTLNSILLVVGAGALLFALLLGAYMARRLSNPISRVIKSANQIAKGDFSGRIPEISNTKEIGELTTTINGLAETLEGQETLRKHLSADVAHELNTPLATLQSHIEAMIDGIWKPDKQRLKSCHEEVIRINKLVKDIEKLARYESENLNLHKTDFDLSALIQNITGNFEADFANKGININFTDRKHKINADKDKISQVLVNLLSNALKYTEKGGSIDIELKETTDKIAFSVKDNGIGISSEDLPHVFERFFRADKSRNRMTGGSGIGLSIVKAIIDAHKGSIDVNSEPAKGTEFIVILPKHAE